MDSNDIQQHIVRRLTRGVSRDTIISEVCGQTGMNWRQAEAFIEEVESGETQAIARGNLPLMMGIGIVIMIGGFFLTAYSIILFFGPFIDGTLSELSGDVMTPYVLENWVYLVETVVGIAMMAGGGFGIGRAMSSAVWEIIGIEVSKGRDENKRGRATLIPTSIIVQANLLLSYERDFFTCVF
jgi:hypothetical protein